MACPVCGNDMEMIEECNEVGDQVWQCTDPNCGERAYRCT